MLLPFSNISNRTLIDMTKKSNLETKKDDNETSFMELLNKIDDEAIHSLKYYELDEINNITKLKILSL